MTEREHPAYCGRCGSSVRENDTFCGMCGAAILAPPPQAEQIIPKAVAAQGPATRSRKPLFLAAILGALVVLLVGGGALAFVGLSGRDLLGGSEQNPPPSSNNREVAPSQPKTVQEPTSLAPTTSASPSSASSEEAQLEEFGREYDAATRREDWKTTYSMLDESSQQKLTEQEWADKQQALRDANGTPAPLESVSVQPNEQMSDSPATVTLHYQDGTQETMKAMIPMVVQDPSDSGVPKRFLTDEEISELDQLSSLPPESTTSATPESTTDSFGLHPEGADQVREAVQNYYYAVDYEVWKSTYYNLDSESKALFTQEEWIKKNQWYADHENLKLDTMNIYVTMEGDNKAKVTVDRTFKDGTSISRETVFVWDNGWWKHHLTDEEIKTFRPDLSYEEFVQAQQ